MQGRLNTEGAEALNIQPALREKIARLNTQDPYVWRLQLSETDFTALEAAIQALVQTQGSEALTTKANALYGIVFIAEWYKRRYQSGNKNELIDSIDLEKLWTASGINQRYLYHDHNGNRRWRYSIYVLGGLAIKHELGRNDNMRFLKGLCRLYNGEDYNLENLGEAGRAAAFGESIRQHHSLYEYLREILDGNLPFNPTDLADSQSDANRFVAAIRTAYDEIRKVKYRLEWQVTFSPDYQNMVRRLNVWMKPEEAGGGLHQYLRYDRVRLWGLQHPERLKQLDIYIRFMRDGVAVEPSIADKPIFTYLPHSELGFVAFGVERCVVVRNIPTKRFDSIQLFARDQRGKDYMIQEEPAREWMQLWRNGDYGTTWTSTRNSQRETALLFSSRCRLKDANLEADVYQKCFSDKRFGKSEPWNWIYIYDSIIFFDEKGTETSLYNRIGFDEIATRRYSDTIHYIGGSRVRHYFADDDPEFSDGLESEELPLIFSPQDISVFHFDKRDDVLTAEPVEDAPAETVLFKNAEGCYTEWTDEVQPPYGVLSLRVMVKGDPKSYRAIYLPALSEDKPIERDFDNCLIRYRKPDNTVADVKDAIPEDGHPLEPTLSLRFGSERDYYEVEVYRPTLIKEVMLDGKIVSYKHDGDTVLLPYIYKQRVQVNDFSHRGYQAYACKHLCSIYNQSFINIEGNNNEPHKAAMAAWKEGRIWRGKELDINAPACLYVCFGSAEGRGNWEGCEALRWNYARNTEPEPTKELTVNGFGLIFQDLSHATDLTCNYPVKKDNNGWAMMNMDISLVKCFEVANNAGCYFFTMKPLFNLPSRKIISGLYEPLLEARGGKLTDKDRQGLIRFGEEFGFDWQQHDINLEH